MKSKTIQMLGLFTFAFLFNTASAVGVPTVTSFTASPQSLNYGYSTALSWNITNGGGGSIYFACPQAGVTIKRDTGTTFPCNVKQLISVSQIDSAGFFINNFTGNPIVLVAKVIPQDSTGVDYDAGASSINLYVGAIPNPITDFTYATSSTATSTYPITFSWIGLEIGGTNLQFDCRDGVQIYSTNPVKTGQIVCGQPAYSSDLTTSGSATLYFVNNNLFSVDQTIRIFPAISPGIYDATHAKSLTITIPPKPLPLAASIASFISPQTLLASGQNINLSWIANNTSGVNLQMPCQNSLTWNMMQGTTTTALLCGVPGSAAALSATGSTTVSFTNTGSAAVNIPLSLFPQNTDGTYDGTKARVINLTVLAPGFTPPITSISSQSQTATTPKAETVGTQGIKANHTTIFSVYLRLGSRGAQVSAIQKFLKDDPSLYPEGKVTGYMGPATVAAIKRFQERYNVAKPGVAGYGEVGPKTRAKLNSIQNF